MRTALLCLAVVAGLLFAHHVHLTRNIFEAACASTREDGVAPEIEVNVLTNRVTVKLYRALAGFIADNGLGQAPQAWRRANQVMNLGAVMAVAIEDDMNAAAAVGHDYYALLIPFTVEVR